MYTNSENAAALLSALAVSRFVSWYSGAKLAQTSIPYADQHMMNSHISATERSLKPRDGSPALWTYSRFELDQSPVKYGITMKMNSGTISSAPVT